MSGWAWFFAMVSLLLAAIIAVLTWLIRHSGQSSPDSSLTGADVTRPVDSNDVLKLREERADLSRSVDRLTQELAAERQQTGRNLETIARRAELEIEQRVALEVQRLEAEWHAKKRTDRQVSNQLSRAALLAKIAEHMGPLIPGFPYPLKEVRHIGEVFDFLVYEGLEQVDKDGGEISIVFLEVKTSATGRTRRVTNPREKALRNAVKAGRVRYEVWQPPNAAVLEQMTRHAIEQLEVPALTEGEGT